MTTVSYKQQGDVLLKEIAELPEDLIAVEGDLVLQHGERTGHKHQFLAGSPVEVYTTRNTGEKYIRIVGNTVELFHEEHKPLNVSPGIYKVDIVREYDYDREEMAPVVD